MDSSAEKTGTRLNREALGLHISFIGDIVCPFSFLGRRRLQRALASLDSVSEPQLEWQPFELNPEMPKGGLPLEQYLDRRFGDARVVEPVLAQIAESGKVEGIEFDFPAMKTVPNTLDAHRLILKAGESGRHDDLVEALYRGFFEQGLDVGDLDTLVELAAAVGINRGEAAGYLAGQDGVSSVRAFERQLRDAGVIAVPNIILNGQVTVAGAQDSPTIVAAIDRALFGPSDGPQGSSSIH